LSTNTKHEVVYINLDNAVAVTRNMSPSGVEGSIPQFDLSLLPFSNLSKIGQSLTQVPTGVRNAHASVWKKTQASLDDRNQTSDQKIDV
jgi:hypothetical protein